MRVTTVARASACRADRRRNVDPRRAGADDQQPGQMTQARVWVQNRGRAEAVPVELRDVNLDAPLKVQVINGEPAFAATNPVQVTEVRQVWDYESITVQPTDDVADGAERAGRRPAGRRPGSRS